MTKLFLTFSDGTYHYGEVLIYRPGSDRPSWSSNSIKTFLTKSDNTAFIGLKDGSLYTIGSVVKVTELTKEEYLAYCRDTKLTKILQDEN